MSHLLCSVQSDELSLQKKLRTEVIQLEDTLAQVRKEYEMLRIEFEQNLAANEQAGMFQKHTFTPLRVGQMYKNIQYHAGFELITDWK